MRHYLPLLALLLARAPASTGEAPPAAGAGAIRAGFASHDITPPAGTPSAGYGARLGVGMVGVHDPLLSTALVIATTKKTLVLVGVDSLGFDHGMVEEIRSAARAVPGLEEAEIHLGSSHTHAGGGAFISYPAATILFGIYHPDRRREYVAGAVESIRKAAAGLRPARLGIAQTQVEGLNRYRGKWPKHVRTNPFLTLLKVVDDRDRPLAALFVFAAHPTVLGAENLQFSADFVGPARRLISSALGGAGCVYFNGAQGDVSPAPPPAPDPKAGGDRFAACERMGAKLAEAVAALWARTEVKDEVLIETERIRFTRPVVPSSNGFRIAGGDHETEMSAIAFDRAQAFVTVPGELSAVYDAEIRQWGEWLGFRHATVLGLTDDAMGYLITPEAYRHRTYESSVSFGGPDLGPYVKDRALELMHLLEPDGAFNGSRGRVNAGPATPPPAAAESPRPAERQ
jgi:hypothetical protein